jgi:hypothetical protein
MNRNPKPFVPQPLELDREAQIRKQTFFILDSFERRRDAFALVEMNGERCASRQMFQLFVYNRPQRRLAYEKAA